MNESLIRPKGISSAAGDEIYLAMGIDRHHPLLEGVKHGLTLLKLGGCACCSSPSSTRFRPRTRLQVPSAQTSALNRMVSSTSQRLLAMSSSASQ